MDIQANPYIIIASALLALAGFYLPGFSGWYEKQAAGRKQLIMLAAIFVVVAGRFALGCLGKDAAFACDQNGAFDALVEFFVAVTVNAGVYKATNYLQKPTEPEFNLDDLNLDLPG